MSLYWDQPQVGTNLKATLTDPDGGFTGKSWKWSSSDFKTGPYTEISTATSDTYTPVANDLDKYLRARVAYTDEHDPGKTADAVSVRAVRAPPGNQQRSGIRQGSGSPWWLWLRPLTEKQVFADTSA